MEKEELRELAETDLDAAFQESLTAIQSSDRNLRVLALRIVGRSGRSEGAAAVIAGLGDPKKRVRRAAFQAAGRYLDHPEVADRLLKAWREDPRAPWALVGRMPQPEGGLTPGVREVMKTVLGSLTESERYRSSLLTHLLRMDMNSTVEQLLSEYVQSGTKEEAVAATRALCGYRLSEAGWVRRDGTAEVDQ
jgi:hypothetical protein